MSEFELPSGPTFDEGQFTLDDLQLIIGEALIVGKTNDNGNQNYTKEHKRLAKRVYEELVIHGNTEELFHLLRQIGPENKWKVNKAYKALYGKSRKINNMFDDFYKELDAIDLFIAMELLGMDIEASMRKRGKLMDKAERDWDVNSPEYTVNVTLSRDVAEGDPEASAMYDTMQAGFASHVTDPAQLYKASHSLVWKGTFAARKKGSTFETEMSIGNIKIALKAMFDRNQLSQDLIETYIGAKQRNSGIEKLMPVLKRVDDLTNTQAELLRRYYPAFQESRTSLSKPVGILDHERTATLQANFDMIYYNLWSVKDDAEGLMRALARKTGALETLVMKEDPEAETLLQEIAIDVQTQALIKGWKPENYEKHPEVVRYVSQFQIKALGKAFEMLAENESEVEKEYWKYKKNPDKLESLVKLIKKEKSRLKAPKKKDLEGVRTLITSHPTSKLNNVGVTEDELKAIAARYNIDAETYSSIMHPRQAAVIDWHGNSGTEKEPARDAPEKIPGRVANLDFYGLIGIKGFLTEYLLLYKQKVGKNKNYTIANAANDVDNKYGMKAALANFEKGIANLQEAGVEDEYKVLRDLTFDYQKISKMSTSEAKTAILEGLKEKKDNAREVRDELTSNPDKIWEMVPVINMTQMQLGHNQGYLAQVIEMRMKDHQDSKFWTDIALGALGLVLGIAGLFTGGLTTVAGVALLTGSIALSAFEIYRAANERGVNEAISNTALNEMNELGDLDQSWLGVVLAVVGLGFDLFSVIKGLKLVGELKDFNKALPTSIKTLHETLEVESKLGYSLEKFQKIIAESVSDKSAIKMLGDTKFKTSMMNAFGIAFEDIPGVVSAGLAQVKHTSPKLFERLMTKGVDVLTLNKIATSSIVNPKIGMALEELSSLLPKTDDFITITAAVFKNQGTGVHDLHIVLQSISKNAKGNQHFLRRIMLDPELQSKIVADAADGNGNRLYELYLEFLKKESRNAQLADGDFKRFLHLEEEAGNVGAVVNKNKIDVMREILDPNNQAHIDRRLAAWKKYHSKNPGADQEKYFKKYDTLAINRKIGAITEETFQELLGGEPKNFWPIVNGNKVLRKVDNFLDNVAREIKSGPLKNSKFIREQIEKDIELARTKLDLDIEWHLFGSPNNQKLIQELRDNGITVIEY